MHIIGIISGVLAISATFPYLYDIYKGTTKPNQVSWLIFVLLLTIALFSQIASGASISLFVTIGDLITCFIVFIVSLFRGERKWSALDYFALAAAIVSLGLWYLLNNPAIALVMTILIHCCGMLPTLRKTYLTPSSETLSTWLLVGISAILSTITVGEYNWTLLIYPFYLALANLSVVAIMRISPYRKKTT